MSPPTPRKRFGQHFLHDRTVISHIMAALAPSREDHLVEIGPGQGALTIPLLEHCTQLDVVELDRDLIPALQGLATTSAALKVHQADALRFDFNKLVTGDDRPLRVVGNLPYNISTPLLFHLLQYAPLIHDMHFMLQKEVVERMVAPPGSRTYGRLSIMLQYRCQLTDLFHIPPTAFSPPPQVESAVVRLKPFRTLPLTAVDEALFSRVVTQAFSYRRKTLRNALKGLVSPDLLSTAGIDPGLRPEMVSVANFVRLSNLVAQSA